MTPPHTPPETDATARVRTAADVLNEARRLIVEKGWTQNAYARRDDGDPCNEDDQYAVCFCASGALYAASWRVAGSQYATDIRDTARQFLRRAIGGAHVPQWNDNPSRSASEVLAAFDRAIELAASTPRTQSESEVGG